MRIQSIEHRAEIFEQVYSWNGVYTAQAGDANQYVENRYFLLYELALRHDPYASLAERPSGFDYNRLLFELKTRLLFKDYRQNSITAAELNACDLSSAEKDEIFHYKQASHDLHQHIRNFQNFLSGDAATVSNLDVRFVFFTIPGYLNILFKKTVELNLELFIDYALLCRGIINTLNETTPEALKQLPFYDHLRDIYRYNPNQDYHPSVLLTSTYLLTQMNATVILLLEQGTIFDQLSVRSFDNFLSFMMKPTYDMEDKRHLLLKTLTEKALSNVDDNIGLLKALNKKAFDLARGGDQNIISLCWSYFHSVHNHYQNPQVRQLFNNDLEKCSDAVRTNLLQHLLETISSNDSISKMSSEMLESFIKLYPSQQRMRTSTEEPRELDSLLISERCYCIKSPSFLDYIFTTYSENHELLELLASRSQAAKEKLATTTNIQTSTPQASSHASQETVPGWQGSRSNGSANAHTPTEHSNKGHHGPLSP